MMLTHEEELLFIRHIHLVAERVKNDRDLTEDNIRMIRDLFPELLSILSRLTTEEAYDVFAKYKDQEFFGADIEALLTPKGRVRVANELRLIKEFSQKHSSKKS